MFASEAAQPKPRKKRPLSIYSIGRVCEMLGITRRLASEVARELGIEPALTIDDLEHFSLSAVNRMRQAIKAKE